MCYTDYYLSLDLRRRFSLNFIYIYSPALSYFVFLSITVLYYWILYVVILNKSYPLDVEAKFLCFFCTEICYIAWMYVLCFSLKAFKPLWYDVMIVLFPEKHASFSYSCVARKWLYIVWGTSIELFGMWWFCFTGVSFSFLQYFYIMFIIKIWKTYRDFVQVILELPYDYSHRHLNYEYPFSCNCFSFLLNESGTDYHLFSPMSVRRHYSCRK